jgi:hypothetical protein
MVCDVTTRLEHSTHNSRLAEKRREGLDENCDKFSAGKKIVIYSICIEYLGKWTKLMDAT